MRYDIFAWVRLLMLVTLILAFAHWCSTAETDTRLEQQDPTHAPQATTLETIPTTAEATPKPTFSNPTEESTPPTEAATIATEPPTEPETEPTELQPTYTEEELEMMALVIYQEAGADRCSDDTRLMVGTVVMNRIADPRFPDTMYEVLTQEAQYGRLHWTGIVWPDRARDPDEAHAVDRAYEIAERILLGERVLPADVIWQAEFVQGSEVVAYSDGMYFCR